MPTNVVTQLDVKSHNTPDEKRRPDKAAVDVVTVGDYTIGRLTFEPGWRWSESIKPVVNTDSCQNSHVGFCVAGKLVVETTDGNRINITEGDSYTIPPGHDPGSKETTRLRASIFLALPRSPKRRTSLLRRLAGSRRGFCLQSLGPRRLFPDRWAGFPDRSAREPGHRSLGRLNTGSPLRAGAVRCANSADR